MKITKCENRFEVVVEVLTAEERDELIDELRNWAFDKWAPTDEEYMALMGPCGK
jgi:hypothetical protein